MPIIDEIKRLKAADITKLEMNRKALGVSGKFISECLGLSATVWSTWITQKEMVPEQYMPRVIEILTAVNALKQGEKLLPACKVPVTPPEDTEELLREFLESLARPTIGVFEDKCEAMEAMLKTASEEAQILLELL